MTWDELSEFCLSLPGTTSDYPFDEVTAVFRVGGKIFALCAHVSPCKANLKCEPGLARDLRQSYPDIVPGWHMNKEHWNTVNLEGALETPFLESLIQHSYDRVKEKLPKRR